VKLSLFLLKHCIMQVQEGSEGIAPQLFPSADDGGEWFKSKEGAHVTDCIGGWVDHRTGLGIVEKRKISCLRHESNPGRAARSPSLYRLSCPDSKI
jgi:hypothetical protein